MIKLVIFLLFLFAIWYYYDIKFSKKAEQKRIDKEQLTEAQKNEEIVKYIAEFKRIVLIFKNTQPSWKQGNFVLEANNIGGNVVKTIDWNVYLVDENYKKHFSPQCVLWRAGVLGGMQVSGCTSSQI